MATVARHDGSVGALQNAPAVFMRVNMENIPERWLDTKELKMLRARLREKAAAA